MEFPGLRCPRAVQLCAASRLPCPASSSCAARRWRCHMSKKIDLSTAPQGSGSTYPAPFDVQCRGRSWHRLGAAAGLTQMGVNLVRLAPGAWSSQRHWHTHEDEFVYVLTGELVLVTDDGEEIIESPAIARVFPRVNAMAIACRIVLPPMPCSWSQAIAMTRTRASTPTSTWHSSPGATVPAPATTSTRTGVLTEPALATLPGLARPGRNETAWRGGA